MILTHWLLVCTETYYSNIKKTKTTAEQPNYIKSLQVGTYYTHTCCNLSSQCNATTATCIYIYTWLHA